MKTCETTSSSSQLDRDGKDSHRRRPGGRTYIDLNRTIDRPKAIDYVEFVVLMPMNSGFTLGVFRRKSGNVFECVDSQHLGTLPQGPGTISGLALEAASGDYVGCFFATGAIAVTESRGLSGLLSAVGDHTAAGSVTTYEESGGQELLLSVTGENI